MADLLANDEVLEGLDEAVRKEMREIRDAIARIDAGHYGVCERCGSEIPVERLHSLPHVRQCISCAVREEDQATGR